MSWVEGHYTRKGFARKRCEPHALRGVQMCGDAWRGFVSRLRRVVDKCSRKSRNRTKTLHAICVAPRRVEASPMATTTWRKIAAKVYKGLTPWLAFDVPAGIAGARWQESVRPGVIRLRCRQTPSASNGPTRVAVKDGVSMVPALKRRRNRMLAAVFYFLAFTTLAVVACDIAQGFIIRR